MADNFLTKKEDILADIEERLKEEKWTRAAIESYTVKNFIELDGYIRLSINENFKEELKTICKEALKQSQNSLVGLYVVGILSLEESSIDDTHLPQIIKIFVDNKKLKVAEFLSEKILSYRENKFALKTLESIYEGQSEDYELFNIKKRLVLIDSKDAVNAKFLGEHYEAENDKELAMFYYRLAIERFIRSKSVKMVEDLWNRIIKLYPEDERLIISIAKKISEILGTEKVGDMVFNAVVKPAMKDEKYPIALNLIKAILNFKPHDKAVRKAIVECYRNIYAEHSHLEEYLKASAIGQSWKPHREAIRIFESHIAFDADCYVLHRNWGVGVVKSIEEDEVILDFDGKTNHKMTLKIALRALSVLNENHIVIWKKTKLDELKQMMFEAPLRVLEILLKSYKGSLTSKEIKEELVSDVLDEKEWLKWWASAKRAMAESNIIMQSLTKRNVYELRNSEITIEQELISKFKKTTNFENKVSLFIDYIDRVGDVNSDNATALVSYLEEIVKASSESNERKIVAYSLLKYGKWENYNGEEIDSSIIFGIKKSITFYENLNLELKKSFLQILEDKLKDWEARFSDLILNSDITKTHSYLVKRLIYVGKYDILENIYITILHRYQENPELFIWFIRLILAEEDVSIEENIGVKESEVVFRMLSLIDILNAEIQVKTNVGRNKKVIKIIQTMLFNKGMLNKFVELADETTAKSLHSLLMSLTTIDKDLQKKYDALLVEKYPELEKVEANLDMVKIRHPFIVSEKLYNQKKSEFQHMITIEVPENSKAIGEAMEKGDLRENAEYKAALEKQDHLKAATAKLESQLNQAKILDRNSVDVSIVDVGTRVQLKEESGDIEIYTILGQWDVDYENGIISYHSPMGRALLDKKVGDTINFVFNNETKTYNVLKIEIADF